VGMCLYKQFLQWKQNYTNFQWNDNSLVKLTLVIESATKS
jgi:hypothetical protein